MNRYVCGFLFHIGTEHNRVLLIKKNRPEWMAGKLNGIGGSIELNETPLIAMRREFNEECGLDVENWKHFSVVHGDNSWIVNFFWSVANYSVFKNAYSKTDEQIVDVNVEQFLSGDEEKLPHVASSMRLALNEAIQQ